MKTGLNASNRERAVKKRERAVKDLTFPGRYVTIRAMNRLREGSKMAGKTEALTYKGRPLRRKDNLIYYGSMADKYVIMLQVLDSKKVKDLDVATKVSVQLQLTAADVKSRDRVVKKTEKDSLYAAMDVAAVWLERALSQRM